MGKEIRGRMASIVPSGLLSMVRGSLGRAERGLYGGKKVMSGHNISFAKNRTKRKWKPNVQTKRLPSSLDEVIKLKVTTHALRCINKAGGLDEYILGLKGKLEPGTKEFDLKTRILEAQKASALASGASEPVAAVVSEVTV